MDDGSTACLSDERLEDRDLDDATELEEDSLSELGEILPEE